MKGACCKQEGVHQLTLVPCSVQAWLGLGSRRWMGLWVGLRWRMGLGKVKQAMPELNMTCGPSSRLLLPFSSCWSATGASSENMSQLE